MVIQYIPRNMHTVFALLCFVVVIHWLIFPYPSGLLHWHCGNLTIAPVPAKQPWWIWANTSREFIMNDYITTTKQSTTKPCANFLGYTVHVRLHCVDDGLAPTMHSALIHADGLSNPQLTQNNMAAISQTTFSSAFSLEKIVVFWFKIHCILFLWVQLTIDSICSSNRLATNHYVNQWWPCFTNA